MTYTDDVDMVLCPWGQCTFWVYKGTRKVDGGCGPVGCPCDLLPGWNSPTVDGFSKPRMPVKARGRHGSRVQRSKRRQRDVITVDGVRTHRQVFRLIESLKRAQKSGPAEKTTSLDDLLAELGIDLETAEAE